MRILAVVLCALLTEACFRADSSAPAPTQAEPCKRKEFYRADLIRLAGEDAKLKETLQALLDGASMDTVLAARNAVLRKEDKALASALAEYLAECVLEHPDPGVRQLATWALCRLDGKSAAPQIATRLEDADPNVRELAAQALGWLGEKSAAPQLIKLLGDVDTYVRKAAAWSLRRLSGEKWPDDKLVDSARAWWGRHKDDAEWKAKP